MQPNTASEGDNTINTKKGFLISFPAKKKNGEEASSGIVMAKTVNNDTVKSAPSPEKENKNEGGKNHGKNKGKHDNNNNNNNNNQNRHANGGKNNQNEQKKQEKNQKPQNNSQQNNQQNNNNQQKNNQNQKKNDKNQKKNDKNINQNQKQQNNNNNNNNNNNKKNQQEQKVQPEASKNKNDRRDRDRKNDRNERNGKNAKRSELPGLSPLSKDMRDYAKASAEDIVKAAEKTAKEPSLEEKYKDAIPLAEQIAAEEAKRKVKPRSMVTNKIDRSLTGNAELEAVVKAAENNPDAQIKIPDTGKSFEVVGIRFREAGKIYYFDPNGKDVPYGTPVIVETARGAEYGYTAISNRLVPASSVIPPLKKIKRIATQTDTEKYVANKALESDAAEIFKSKVAALGLEMNLIFVEYTFDNSKLLFYFTAETRIDFRELVKELASVFRTRIELRQIGVRDEAKMLGGLGVCGRSVCCNSFLGDFAQVSIKMAKDQGLSLNSAKISGACGKLMCCLRYEDKVYEEEMARTPKVGSVVETSEGRGVVTEALPLKGIVKVTLEASPETPPKPFSRDDVKVVGFNKAAVKEDAEEMKKLKALEDNN